MAFREGFLKPNDYAEVLRLTQATGLSYTVDTIRNGIEERTAIRAIRTGCDDADAIARGEIGDGADAQAENTRLLRDALIFRLAGGLVNTAPQLTTQETAGLSQTWEAVKLADLRDDYYAKADYLLTLLPECETTLSFTAKTHFTRGGPD